MHRLPCVVKRSCRHPDTNESAHAYEVVRRVCEGEQPPHSGVPSLVELAQSADGFGNECLFDELSFHRTNHVPLIASRAITDGTGGFARTDVLRDVWGDD